VVIAELTNLNIRRKYIFIMGYVVREKISVYSTRTVEQNWNFLNENIVDKYIPAKQVTASNR